MKAIVVKGINQPLRVKQVPIRQLDIGEILVQRMAEVFNRRDWWIQQGQYAALNSQFI